MRPNRRKAFDAGRKAFGEALPEEIGALGYCVDLAERAFNAEVEDYPGADDDPRFESEAPILAQLIIAETVMAWRKTAKKRSR